MLNLKLKILFVGLALMLAACSSNGNTAQTAGQGQAQTQGQTTGQIQPRATALPTRAVAASTTVAADGVLALAAPQISLAFEQSGKVTAVNVTLGQAVKKGDVLATIDDTTLQDAVTDAELALKLLEVNTNQQNAPATEEELKAAQAALNAAYASYSETRAGTSQSDIDTAKRSVDAAWMQYLAAQKARDMACGEGIETNGCQSQEASYGNAYESWAAAVDNYEKLLEPVSQNSLTQSYASVASAKSKLDALKAGVSEEQLEIDQAQYNQAKSTLEQAHSDLSKATLVSPCDCVVQAINVAVGATGGSDAFTLVDLSLIQFKTTNLSESDVDFIQTSAAVTIRLKPYEEEFTGKVSTVLQQSSGTQGNAALYTALIDLDPTDKLLLPGMTGQAEIAIP